MTELGIEGLLYRNPEPPTGSEMAEFDGVIDLHLELRNGSKVFQKDDIRLAVAPWMLTNNYDRTREIWAIKAPGNNDLFIAGIAASGLLKTVPEGSETQWFQDHVEIGFTGLPKRPTVTSTFRLPYVRPTPVPPWPVEPNHLLARSRGVFSLGRWAGSDAGDYGGNIELLAPSVSYPSGRIVIGNTRTPELQDFLTAQRIQKPFTIDTEWLAVGHVDEIIAIIDQNRIAIASPRKAYQLLDAMDADKRESVLYNSFATVPNPALEANFPKQTVNKFLQNTSLRTLNLVECQSRIDIVRSVIETAMGRTFIWIEIPTIYEPVRDEFGTPYPGMDRSLAAYFPGGSNFQVANGKLYFPKQYSFGCGVGEDVFEQAIKQDFPDAIFVDDWALYHVQLGEVHCGTNAVRDGDSSWSSKYPSGN